MLGKQLYFSTCFYISVTGTDRHLIHRMGPGGSPLGPHPHAALLKQWMGHSVREGGYGRPTESDRLWLLDQEQVPSWHRDVIIQFNRAFDARRGENGALDHALQPRPYRYGSYESPELVAAERGIAWRSFLLSHKCSMYDASANSAAAEQNVAFPALEARST